MQNAVFLGAPDKLSLAYSDDARRRLGELARVYGIDIPGNSPFGHTAALADAEVIFGTWGMPKINADFLSTSPQLKAVFYAAGSVKGFVTDELFCAGVRVCSAWQANAVPVAEFAFSLIVLSLKGAFRLSRHYCSTRGQRVTDGVVGAYRTKVGLVSLGAIGRLVLARLHSLDVEVLVHDPFVDSAAVTKLGATPATLEELFSACDVVSLHTPWLKETEGLVESRLLRSMKPNATLINTSRGAIVDETALCAELKKRSDLHAVLDVTYPEPPDAVSPLFDLSNVFLTPHIAGSIGGEVTRMGDWMVAEFERFIRGEQLLHEVTAETVTRMA